MIDFGTILTFSSIFANLLMIHSFTRRCVLVNDGRKPPFPCACCTGVAGWMSLILFFFIFRGLGQRETRTENPRAGGSIPPLGTGSLISFKIFSPPGPIKPLDSSKVVVSDSPVPAFAAT